MYRPRVLVNLWPVVAAVVLLEDGACAAAARTVTLRPSLTRDWLSAGRQGNYLRQQIG
jgi:hypothetical protein